MAKRTAISHQSKNLSELYNMRKIIILLSYQVLWLGTFGQVSFNEEDLCKISLHELKGHQNQLGNKAGALSADYDIKYHRLEWQIDPNVYFISGAVHTMFESTVSSLNQIHFDCDTNLMIDSVIAQGSAASWQKLAGSVLQITLPSPVTMGNLDSVLVYYHGIPTGSGFGSFVQSSHGSDSIIWTLSEPYGAREWWPCKQDMNDKIDSIDAFVTCPKGNRSAGNGVLVNVDTSGAQVTYHWKHKHPVPAYLIALSVTNYAAYSEFVNLSTGQLEILNYVYPEDSANLVTQSPQLAQFIQLYDTLFEPYPYMDEKYGHAQWGWGGGMEHSTMSYMSSFGYELLAHELAHQWFGDKVTCGAWQDIWLNEGFASYLTGLTYNYLSPNLYWPLWKRIQVDQITQVPNGSVWVDDTTSVSRVFSSRLTYRKGSMLLHMLRWKLGDKDFYQGVRNYLADTNLAWGYARTSDLKSHLEAQSGLSLTEFFNDWFYGEGYPIYKIEWNQSAGVIWVKISQSTSDPSVSMYEMPVPIRFKGSQGDTTLVFDHTQNVQYFNRPLNFTVDSVFFDPEIWLVAKLDTILAGTNDLSLPEKRPQLFPNPGNGLIHIKGSYRQVSVYDQTGRTIQFMENNARHNEISTLKLRNMMPGLYFIKVDEHVYKYLLTTPSK